MLASPEEEEEMGSEESFRGPKVARSTADGPGQLMGPGKGNLCHSVKEKVISVSLNLHRIRFSFLNHKISYLDSSNFRNHSRDLL